MVAKPLVVSVNETFLTKAIQTITLEGYSLVERRDRQDRWGGGVAVFILQQYEARMTPIEVSTEAERIWCMLHTDHGPFLIGAWYRLPSRGETASIISLEEEWRRHSQSTLGTIVMGDCNVHATHWLTHSSGEYPEGYVLHIACNDIGCKQIVREPNREKYLLDLVCTDLAGVKARVVPGVSDHNMIETTVNFRMPETHVVERKVWDYSHADWEGLRANMVDISWEFENRNDPSAAAQHFTDQILKVMNDFIPQRNLKERKTTHPWLSKDAVKAVHEKHQAVGTDKEAEATAACSAILLSEHQKHTVRMRDKLQQMPAASKQWWKTSRELLDQCRSTCSIPALKTDSGEWTTDAFCKVELLSETFANKCKIDRPETNEFTEIPPSGHCQIDSADIAETDGMKVLAALKIDSSTGPDAMPTRVLRECAKELAAPFVALAKCIVKFGVWPAMWLTHWIIPLHKKKAKSDPKNYRGIHITAQLSKAMERLLQMMYLPYFIATVAFGENQFAYCAGRGARDALALMVCTWLERFADRCKFAIYCSDVSGAFDRVGRERLLDKLRARGVKPELVILIASWLRQRVANVLVGGQNSTAQMLDNMVYQGTVWGPWLWNIMYEDARYAIRECGFTEIVYADDLTVGKKSREASATNTSTMR